MAAERTDKGDAVELRIENAVFSIMETTSIPEIHVHDVLKLASISRSTFYRHFKSVDDVVKRFENDILENMRDINDIALKTRFSDAELDPTPTMVSRMEQLQRNRSKIVTLNGPNGDPTFTHKATIFMHDHFRERLRDVSYGQDDFDLYLSFALAGHNNLIQYWLEERPDLEPRRVAAVLNRLFYAPFFLDETTVRHAPKGLHFD